MKKSQKQLALRYNQPIARTSRTKLPVTSLNPHDVTGNFVLNFRAIGWLYLGAAFDFSSSFFELFLMAISIKIGQVPYFNRTLQCDHKLPRSLGRVRKRHPRMFYLCLTNGAFLREKDRISFGWCFWTQPWEEPPSVDQTCEQREPGLSIVSGEQYSSFIRSLLQRHRSDFFSGGGGDKKFNFGWFPLKDN